MAGNARVSGNSLAERPSLPVGRQRPLQILLLLRQIAERLRGFDQTVAARAIAVDELRRFAIAGGIAKLLGLLQRLCRAVDVVESINKGSRQPEERIRPAAS